MYCIHHILCCTNLLGVAYIYIYIHTGHFVLTHYHNSFQMCLYYIIDFTFLYCVGYFFLSVSLLYISVIILRFLISLSTRDAGLECMFKFCKIIDGNGRLGMRLESCGHAPAPKYSRSQSPLLRRRGWLPSYAYESHQISAQRKRDASVFSFVARFETKLSDYNTVKFQVII